MSHRTPLIAIAAAGCLFTGLQTAAAPSSTPGGAFNLHIVSDSVPDFSSREAFVASALSGWPTDDEKAKAQFRWLHRSRRVGPCVSEDSRPVLDPILFLNSYGITFCSMISQMNCSLWEAWGRPNRLVDLVGHVVSEVHYDGAWHVYDNDFCNYWLKEDGTVAGTADMVASRVHGNVEDLRPGEYYIFDHCATSSSPRGRIFTGPSSRPVWRVAKRWYPSPDKVWVRKGYRTSHAGHRYILGIRPRESYTRYWQPLGTGPDFARLLGNGKDPAEEGGSTLRNSRSNGRWVWAPDLSNLSAVHDAQNARVAAAGIVAVDPDKPAWVTFRVAAANVVTSAKWHATGTGGPEFLVSGNQGLTWTPVPYAMEEAGGFAMGTRDAIGGRLEYLLKVALGKRDRLFTIRIETITQVNPRTLPALRLGANRIAAVSDGHYESIVLNPRLTAEQHEKEVFEQKGWQSAVRPIDATPSVRAISRESYLTLRAETPRPITRVRMAATIHHPEPGGEYSMFVSYEGSESRTRLLKMPFVGWPADHRLESVDREIPAGAREVHMRHAFDFPGSGIVSLVSEVDYQPAGGFMPYGIVYCWSEWRDGNWVERRHCERVPSATHRYTINVGGTRPPRMKSVAVAQDRELRTGYSDGEDVGPNPDRRPYRLKKGANVALGRPYECSRPPARAYPDSDGKLLTDEYIGIASVWGLTNIVLTGKEKGRQVGRLVAFEPGEEVAVTVDLGKNLSVEGARICAIQPNKRMLFPKTMTVELSQDGKTFRKAGTTSWEECFFPPIDRMLWEGTDSPRYGHLPAGGILDHQFHIVFDKPGDARFVRFRLNPAKGKAIGLWELEVFDRLKVEPGDERIRLPPHTPTDSGKRHT